VSECEIAPHRLRKPSPKMAISVNLRTHIADRVDSLAPARRTFPGVQQFGVALTEDWRIAQFTLLVHCRLNHTPLSRLDHDMPVRTLGQSIR
jgi:hypothetical protein